VNEPDLDVSAQHKRFSIWEEPAQHPTTLTMKHFGESIESTDHFARKFDNRP